MNNTLINLIGDARLHETLFHLRSSDVRSAFHLRYTGVGKRNQWNTQALCYRDRHTVARPIPIGRSRPDSTWWPRNNLRIMRTLRGAWSDFPPAWYPVNRLIANGRTWTWSTTKRAEKLLQSDATKIISWSLSQVLWIVFFFY